MNKLFAVKIIATQTKAPRSDCANTFSVTIWNN